MSLLLDALKKAAEQKAAKTKDEDSETGTGSAEETALDVTAGEARDGQADDTSIPRHKLEDETELDHSQLDTRLERMHTAHEDGTETGIDPLDETRTQSRYSDRQAESGEDETLIFAEDDVAEVTGGETGPMRRAADDETDLSQLAADEDDVSLIDAAAAAGRPAEEDTLLGQPASQGDETDISVPPGRADELATGEASPREAAGEETDLNAPAAADAGETAPPEDDTGPIDDDLSLMLVEREQTQLTSPTSATDPQRPQDAMQALQKEAPTSEDFGIVDPTVNRAGDDRTSATDTAQTRTSGTSTTAQASATQTTRATQTARPDTTATHTYAPDNYDRTLMRLPNDDASRLFAGMKSDSDVVMTPDYAKQVFRSKSSAQRVQHYKFYGGIAIVILLGIGVYGVFEYQEQSEVLDTSLRPLKNDPMPGIIRSVNGEQEIEPLFVEAEVNERALEIIQSIEGSEPEGEAPQAAGEDTAEQASSRESASVAAADAAPAAQAAAEQDAPASRQPAEGSRGNQAAAAESMAGSQVAAADNEAISGIIASERDENTAGSSSRLQIEKGERIEEKQVLLREAYDAYQSGNDELALKRYNEVLAIEPGNRNALLARAAIHVQNGEGVAAIRDYQSLLLANPKDSLAMASLITVANYSPVETETQLKLMIRDEPESPHLNFALANVYGAQNRWQEAQGHYYKALQNNPDDPNYAYNLAVSLEHISQPGAAVSYYRRALDNYNKGLATFSREVVDRRLEKLTQP